MLKGCVNAHLGACHLARQQRQLDAQHARALHLGEGLELLQVLGLDASAGVGELDAGLDLPEQLVLLGARVGAACRRDAV